MFAANPAVDAKPPQNHNDTARIASYVHQGKQVCRFVRPQWLEELASQLEVYKTFKSLTNQWIALSIQRARLAFFDASDKKLLPHAPATTKNATRNRKSKPQS